MKTPEKFIAAALAASPMVSEGATVIPNISEGVSANVSKLVSTAPPNPEVMNTTLLDMPDNGSTVVTVGRYDGGSFTVDADSVIRELNFTGFTHLGGIIGRLINSGTIDFSFDPISVDATGKLAEELFATNEHTYYYQFDSGELQELGINGTDTPDDSQFINPVNAFSSRDDEDANSFSFRGTDKFGSVSARGEVIPEPSTGLLTAAGLGLLLSRRKRLTGRS